MQRFLRTFGPPLILVCAVFLAYANVFGNQFLYDDEFLIIKNSLLRSWDGLWRAFVLSSTGGSGQSDAFYRPVQTVAYLLVYQVFGLSTAGFHLLNVTLHALNAVLVFVLGRRLGFSAGPVFLAALCWALHPLHTEAVTYMSATADPGHTFFCLLGLICLTPNWTGWGRVAGAFAFVGGLLMKEPAIVFPALACVCRGVGLAPELRWKWRAYLISWPYWMIALVYLVLRRTVLDFHHTFQFYTQANIYSENWLYRVYTFLATLPAYFGLIAWPAELSMDRSFPVFIDLSSPVLIGVCVFTLFVLTLWLERKRSLPALGFAVLWFFAAHVPQSGVLLPVNALFLEHWMYLPTVGLFLGVAQVLGRSLARLEERGANRAVPWIRRVGFTLALLVSLGLGARTFAQNEVWHDPITFYTHTLAVNPKNARGWNNLAMACSDLGQLDAAERAYRHAIALSDVYPQTHHNLALVLLARGQREGAISELKRALSIDPDFLFSRAKLKEIGAE